MSSVCYSYRARNSRRGLHRTRPRAFNRPAAKASAAAREDELDVQYGNGDGEQDGDLKREDAAIKSITVSAPPSGADLVKFALPTLGAWLVSPLMSLIDTVVVGQSCTATSIELAALGPACAVGDAASYLFSFLGVATTNLVATALARGESRQELASIVSSAARIALTCGAASCVTQVVLAYPLLTLYAGAQSAEIVEPAFSYVVIRAIAAPLVLLTKICTAACLATKDSVAPLLVILAAGALNLAGDILLVSFLGLGIQGAAWATLASEVTAGLAMLAYMAKKLRGVEEREVDNALLGTGTPITRVSGSGTNEDDGGFLFLLPPAFPAASDVVIISSIDLLFLCL